jgi:nitrous oxidase accessory protein
MRAAAVAVVLGSVAALAGAPPLQPLVDATAPGAVLAPPAGTYAGPVVLRRPLTLEGRGVVIVDGLGVGTVITVTSPDVTVRGLHVRGSGGSHDRMDTGISVEADRARVEGNVVDDVLFGVHLKGSNDSVVCGNRISSKHDEPGIRGDGVRVWNGQHNQVVGNDIVDTRDVTFANSQENQVRGNRISGGRYGLQLMFAPRTRVEGNLLDRNLTGVAVLYSESVSILGNTVQNSIGPSGVGLAFKESSQAIVEDNALLHCSVGVKANAPTHPLNVIYFRRNLVAHNVVGMDFYGENGGHVIHGCRFDHNLVTVTVSAPMSARGNDWAHNQWDDYQGFDRDHDGVGDTPHEVFWFADRIWMETPKATFFRNTPSFELLDFLERLAPFASPELIFRDGQPQLAVPRVGPSRTAADWARFVPSCQEVALP